MVSVGCQGHRDGGCVEQRPGHGSDREPFKQAVARGPDDQHVRLEFLARIHQGLRIRLTAANVPFRRDIGRDQRQRLVEPRPGLLMEQGFESGLRRMGRAERRHLRDGHHKVQRGPAASGQ
ncbi:hypothetical protein FQZ97_1188370 [compost metagenome]